jgi:protocatechuate 3,4-dioxygenase beta subunit
MRIITSIIILLVMITSCQAQQRYRIPGSCETCELIDVGKPSVIKSVDTSAGWVEAGQKLLVSGTVFKLDGKTPAAGVIIYYWQTDNNGLYSPSKTMDKGAERHGHIRGWVKTGADGKYAIYTVKPAPYPNSNNPAHIHILIKEPDIENAYYIDEFVFDDDELVTPQMRNNQSKRGGSGILQLKTRGNIQAADHDIILGLNIPGYPSRL